MNDHELYCAGHWMEAAVAHFEATGDRRFIDALGRYVDYIIERFVEKKDTGFEVPGHEEIELALLRMFDATGDRKYLALLRDIISCLPQCVSTEQRPLFSWDREPRKLLPGWINERINTSDWEGNQRIGEVFYGSCWCETSLLLTFSEIIWNEEIRSALDMEG
jgi:hypothetical protein